MSGALCFMGTRVPVKTLFDYLEGASTLEDFWRVSLQYLEKPRFLCWKPRELRAVQPGRCVRHAC